MTEKAEISGGKAMVPWRILTWGGAALVLLLPLVAMQFTSEVDWTFSDFIVMGAMLGGAGLAFEFLLKMSGSFPYRAGAAVAVGACFLLIWVNLAVGFLGDEDNPANLMFLGVIGVAIAGAIAARFRAAGMVRAMLAALAAQVLAGAIGLAAGLASPGGQGLYEVTLGTTLFGGLWLLSAALFRKAAGRQP